MTASYEVILGIIDSNGAVHSKACDDFVTHDEVFPVQTHCRWRWYKSSGLQWFRPSDKPNDEQLDAIERHLNKKYRIPITNI